MAAIYELLRWMGLPLPLKEIQEQKQREREIKTAIQTLGFDGYRKSQLSLEKEKASRNYEQNLERLQASTGISSKDTYELHGDELFISTRK